MCASPSSSHVSSNVVADAVHVHAARRVDQMLVLVRHRAVGERRHLRLRPLVAVDDAAGIGHEQIEHLGDVAAEARARRAATFGRDRAGRRSRAPRSTRPADVSSLTARVKNRITWPLLSMSRRRAERGAIDRIDERIERHADRLDIRRR